ncbi:MAG: addiction module protein [Planctomycetota bacterium]|nr:addiction module protein [Planctomycetota bacterium]
MSVKEISIMALKLPVRSRALLADLLLDSLDEGSADANEKAWVELAKRRDDEISKGRVACKTHTEVMKAARAALRCVR